MLVHSNTLTCANCVHSWIKHFGSGVEFLCLGSWRLYCLKIHNLAASQCASPCAAFAGLLNSSIAFRIAA
jgi:hypothetical protein